MGHVRGQGTERLCGFERCIQKCQALAAGTFGAGDISPVSAACVRCQTVDEAWAPHSGSGIAGRRAQATRMSVAPHGAAFENRAKAMSDTENHLIELLPMAVQKTFIALCEPFDLVLSTELIERGQQLTHAYFPRTGFISLVVDVDSHPPLEVGMIGRESMLGSELVLGLAKTPWRAVVQGDGHCLRIEVRILQKAMARTPALQTLVKRSLMVRLHQQSLASACERFHPIGQRLARWLLMSQDRADSDQFHVTQEFISLMLGVRRVGVTQSASDFQKNGLIEYRRGELKVLDRQGLEDEACSCYEADKLLYNELMSANT